VIAVGCKLEALFTFGINHRVKIESAPTLQRQLAMLTGHELAHVKPYGKHLLLKCAGVTTLTTLRVWPSKQKFD
jgi:hypothetical protein